MKLKKSVIILGRTWKIKEFDKREDVDIDNDKMIWGQCVPSKREIRIWSKLDDEEKASTFYHELVHAILEETHLHNNFRGKLKEEDYELLAELLAKVWIDTMKRNGIKI